MHSQVSRVWMAGFAFALMASLGATAATAASLPCAQRAINWNRVGQTHVRLTAVALHSSGVAAYASGSLINASCDRAPYGLGRASCLVTSGGVSALLSDRSFWTPSGGQQPFDVSQPLLLSVDEIPSETPSRVHLRQPNATYDFEP